MESFLKLYFLKVRFFIWFHWVLAVAFRILLVVACGIWFPNQGSNLSPLHWEHGALTTGPPGKSPQGLTLSDRKQHGGPV